MYVLHCCVQNLCAFTIVEDMYTIQLDHLSALLLMIVRIFS